jgi:phosphatidylglycerol:prolipoprotein diacylglycerol transferase
VLAVISYPPIPLFEVGPLRLSLHGLFAALGFLAGAWLATRYVRERGYDVEKFQSVLTWALIGALLGARYLTTGAHIGEPGFTFVDAISPVGSFSIIGGYAGGIFAAWLRIRQFKLPFLAYGDMAAVGMALGTVVGRIGDLAIVEHLGGTTDFFLGFGVKPGYDLAPQHDVLECTPASELIDGFCGVYHHTALYDMAGAAVLMVFLMWLYRSGARLRYGQMFFTWVAWYGIQRFLIDFTRLSLDVNGDATLGPFTWSQWSGLLAGIAGLFVIWLLGRRGTVMSEDNDVELGATVSA